MSAHKAVRVLGALWFFSTVLPSDVAELDQPSTGYAIFPDMWSSSFRAGLELKFGHKTRNRLEILSD